MVHCNVLPLFHCMVNQYICWLCGMSLPHWYICHMSYMCRLLIVSKPQGMSVQRQRGQTGRHNTLPSSPALLLPPGHVHDYPHPSTSQHSLFPKAKPAHRIDKHTGKLLWVSARKGFLTPMLAHNSPSCKCVCVYTAVSSSLFNPFILFSHDHVA